MIFVLYVCETVVSLDMRLTHAGLFVVTLDMRLTHAGLFVATLDMRLTHAGLFVVTVDMRLTHAGLFETLGEWPLRDYQPNLPLPNQIWEGISHL